MPVQISFSAKTSTASAHGVEQRAVPGGTYLNQLNGTPVSLSPGLPDLEDQFGQIGAVDLRAHDWYGVADIDTDYDTTYSDFLDQITNNAPADKVAAIKTFTMDFFNRRTILLNAAEYLAENAQNVEPQFNWVTTDAYLKRTLANQYYKGTQKPNVLFRIGRMINGGRGVPRNITNYCNVVREIVDRYTNNYQSIGLPVPITNYEIWNEPDLGLFWSTPGSEDTSVTQFYAFYKAVASTIKAAASTALVGPCGTANAFGNKDYVDNLIDYIKANSLPLDFYSYHFYADQTGDSKNIFQIQKYVRDTLNSKGFPNAKTYISEWNLTAYASKVNNTKLQSVVNAAFIVSFLIDAEQAGVDKAYYYRGDGAEFGLFNDQNTNNGAGKNFATYAAQAFWLYNAFAAQRALPIVKNTNTDKTGITATGAKNQAGNQIQILLANYKVASDLVGNDNRDKLPGGVSLYGQFYIDSNIAAQSIDANRWYGTTLVPPRNNNKFTYNGGEIPRGPFSSNQNNQLAADSADYSNSSSGYTITVTDIPAGFTKYTVAVRKVFQGSQLASLDGETIVHTASETIPANRQVVVKDNDPVSAGNNTLALITIDLA